MVRVQEITKRNILRQYRHWLRIAVSIPKSLLVQMNDHVQMNEQALIVIRQKFREGAAIKEDGKIRILVQDGERSLAMMKSLAKNKALKEFPLQTQPPINYFSLAPMRHIAWESIKAYAQELYYNYVRKRW
mmetsp:Transcript_24232/g.37789  ORF Transcript_24232/g.37789 Transcript_24232/m.37789 type:complete len:131 (-) Transcript_24232:82-474(-)